MKLSYLGALTSVLSAFSAEAADTPVPAIWQKHALIVDLQNLPKRYTCDELWYKFKDVLTALGAAPDAKILPYECGMGYSPKVQLDFSTPTPAMGKAARWATLQAVSRSTQLQPGNLPHIDDQDCALLAQMRSTLLKQLDDSVTGFHLDCLAPSTSKPAFGLTVRALVPVTEHLVRSGS